MMEESGMLHSYMKESVDGIQTIKAFHAEAHTKARTRELFTVFVTNFNYVTSANPYQSSLVTVTLSG